MTSVVWAAVLRLLFYRKLCRFSEFLHVTGTNFRSGDCAVCKMSCFGLYSYHRHPLLPPSEFYMSLAHVSGQQIVLCVKCVVLASTVITDIPFCRTPLPPPHPPSTKHTDICSKSHIHIHLCPQLLTHARTHTDAHTHRHTRTRTHIHTDTHTQTHTHAH